MISPAGGAVMRPISLALTRTNQRAPSEPSVMPLPDSMRVNWVTKSAVLLDAETENSVTTPVGAIRPIWLASVNQRAPSGPTVMLMGGLLAVGMENSVTTPAGVIRASWMAPQAGKQAV